MYDFSVHDRTRKQIGSPYFSSIVRQCKWPSLSRKIIEIRKCSYHGNVTSQVSSLSNKALYTEIHSYGKNKVTGQGPDIMNSFSKFPGASLQKGRNSVSTVLIIVTRNSSKM